MSKRWRQIQRNNFRCRERLLQFLHFSAANCRRVASDPRFPLNLPQRLAEKMAKDCPDDPLFRQFVGLAEEKLLHADFSPDPVADTTFQRTPRLLQKYPQRALLLCSSACAMHCRYCFRQHYPYAAGSSDFAAECQQIANDPTLSEIILSGGDPLSLSDTTLSSLLQRLNAIPHLRRIRFHTRFPIGIPERIDDQLLALLAAARKQLIWVIHCNHPQELDDAVLTALQQVLRLGIPILNQAVLLRGVNDSEEVLRALCCRLIDRGILPYYLHQLDRVQGAAHFEVPPQRGQALIAHLRETLPGYAVPTYVQEIAGKASKTPLTSAATP